MRAIIKKGQILLWVPGHTDHGRYIRISHGALYVGQAYEYRNRQALEETGAKKTGMITRDLPEVKRCLHAPYEFTGKHSNILG